MNWYKLAETAELTVTPKEFQAMSYEGKKALASNRNISPEVQLLFFAQEYEDKYYVLSHLAMNTSISSEVQRLFFTEEYSDKNEVLKILFHNPSFLKGLTLKELREFTKTKEARLPVYRKRLKAVKEKILL